MSLSSDAIYTQPSESQIEDLVATFYARIRSDPELGPIFRQAIGEDWGPHLRTMCSFWSSVMLTTGKYKGRPIPAHLKIGGIEPRHFAQWLSLFEATAHDLFPPALAAAFVERAKKIAESFKLAFAFHSPDPAQWAAGLPPLVRP
ncbi:hemoglobin [Dongia mobilis]|uniref:Hemoglobin n=1 Tax=Dongia mobilis TaxID=578943 RepID=A0A4R6WIV4_9PROT|nr:group III truncated hemoglobin [Dongia mobilis]TDQ77594.1 hemoglobin [Dongia mobilis]